MSVAGRGLSPDPKQAAIAAIAQAQAELERAVEQIDALPALGAHSISMACHALSNFLTVSHAVVELLRSVLRDHPNRQVRVWLEGLGHATDLMTHTVSRLTNNTVGVPSTLRLEDVELARLIERACAYYRRAAERKGIALLFDADGTVPTVRTDRVLVAAVLDNLLSNAVKYSIPDRRIWVDVRPERDGVACSVRDEGPGLSRADQERLFRPGARLGPVPSGGEPSTGYGLAVAKEFVALLGGDLTCVSTLGEGTTFSLWLPAPPSPS
jgi:signal transduction histidine kinase